MKLTPAQEQMIDEHVMYMAAIHCNGQNFETTGLVCENCPWLDRCLRVSELLDEEE